MNEINSPTPAYVFLAWLMLAAGVCAYLISLYNADSMELNEKGLYLALLILGLFSGISLQKAVRDKAEGIPTTTIYFGLAWFVTVASVLFLCVCLWNAYRLELSEKGIYLMAFLLSMFSAITVQKNVRDLANARRHEEGETDEESPALSWIADERD